MVDLIKDKTGRIADIEKTVRKLSKPSGYSLESKDRLTMYL